MIHFADWSGRIGNRLNQSEILLIGNIHDFKMVNAAGGLRRGTGWLSAEIIGPSRGNIRSENLDVENSPGNDYHSSNDE